MNALTRFVLDHKRLVLGFWLAVTIAASISALVLTPTTASA